MLTGFEKETAPLTDREMKYIPLLLKGFAAHKGTAKAVTEKKILSGIFISSNIIIPPARLRKMINYIRLNQLPKGYALLSSSKGYWLSANENEIRKCADSLHERGSAILAVSDALKRAAQDIYKPENSYK